MKDEMYEGSMRQQGRKKKSKRKSKDEGKLVKGMTREVKSGKLDLKQELANKNDAKAHEAETYQKALKNTGGN